MSRPSAGNHDGLSTLADDARGLAAAAAMVGNHEWAESAAKLAGGAVVELPALPSYRDLALRGIAVTVALADAERWSESAEQATHLARYFRSADAPISTVAGEAFAGLAASAAAADREGVGDFAEFALEVFA